MSKTANPRSYFINALLNANKIPATYINAKGKKSKTITGHNSGGRFISQHRIKFEPGCGIVDLSGLTLALKKLGITNIVPTKASGARVDQNNGFLVEWQEDKFVLLIKGNIAKGQIRRKQTTPADLGLAGKTFDTAHDLYQAALTGISKCSVDSEVKSTLIDLLDSVYTGKTFTVTDSLKNSNFIQSDFGEILAALHNALSGHVVAFPTNANNESSDFISNGIGFSVKAPNGDHLNLRSYKDNITGSTPVELFFKACATSDYELLFKSLSTDPGICQDLYNWVKQVSKAKDDVTVTDIQTFMSLVTYKEFLSWLKANQPNRNPYGIPTDTKMHIAEDLWSKQNYKKGPFFFAYITLAQKIWGANHIKEISDFAKSVLKQDTSVFITVNINLQSNKVEFTEQKFTNVNTWGVWYIGYCDEAVKNWPAICRTKETK